MVSRQNLTDRLNLIRNATPSTPITKELFATFLDDWINFMTKDGVYDTGALDAWKAQSLNQSSQVSHVATGQLTAVNVKAALEQLDVLIKGTKDGLATIATRPQSILDFAGAKMLPSYATFMRASTASYVDVNGMIKYAKAGQPRFTHNPMTKESLGILIEEARTNSAISSTNFSTNSGLTTSAAKAPDGTNTALLINQTIGSGGGTFSMAAQYTVDGFYTRSMFIKPNNAISAKILFEGIGGPSGSGGNVGFDAVTKIWSGNTSYLIDYGFDLYADGWVRVWMVIERSSTKIVGANHYIEVYGGNATTTQSMYLWGYQLEIGKCPTSYIPTSGSAVTRGIESLSIAVKYVPQLEGSFVLDGVVPGRTESSQNGYRKVLDLNGSTMLFYGPGANGDIAGWDTITTISSGKTVGIDRIAVGYNINTRKMSSNGSAVSSGTFVSSSLNNPLQIGASANSNFLNGTIKRLTIYTRMLTDAELVKVTSATISSNQSGGIPANADLGQLAFMDATTILSAPNRQELSIDGTAASVSRNIRRPYDFSFAIVDSSGVTITSQPAAACLANTDNALIFTAPVGKTITYAITPYFEY
jgi:hypothetical protein